MSYTKASMKATDKWVKNNYDKVVVNIPKGQKEIWKNVAKKQGLPLNAFVKKL